MRSPDRVVAVLAIAALGLAACGDDSTSVSTDERVVDSTTTTSTSSPPSTTAPSTTATSITVPPTPPPSPTTQPAILPPITIPQPTNPATTAAPTTPPTEPVTSTTGEPPTSSTKPAKPTRRTVVFTPAGEPRRKGTLVAPPASHLSTLIVLVHGGNGANGTRNQLREWQDFYAANGYPSLSIDYFLFKGATPPPVYDKPQQDVVAAVQWASANAATLAIDADRIVVQGFTEGAGLGAQDLVADAGAAAAFVGVEGTYDGMQENPEQYYGGPPDSPDSDVQARYARANSVERAADANGPVLLFAASGGPEQLVAQAQAFDGALTSAGLDSRLELVPGGGDFESGGKELTPDAEVVAAAVLAWLQERFPA